MSLLQPDHLTRLTPDQCLAVDRQACWELLVCPKVLCPAHGKKGIDCWLIPRTHCGILFHDDFFNKLASCLGCAYFRARGNKNDTDAWNRFVSEQLHRFNLKTLERIYQKEESFIEILNRIPDGLFTTDKEWRITYFNPAAEKITGFSAYDAVGMFCKDVFKNTICESDCALKRAVALGHDIHNREYTITNIDGEEIPIMCSTSAFRDPTGQVTGGLEIFKEISDIKRLREEVSRREKKYRRIFEGSHDMIYTSNPPGEILDINPAGVELLGYGSKKELLGKTTAWQMYSDPGDRERFLETMNRDGFVKDYEVKFRTRHGSPLHVLISSRRYENPETGDIEYEGVIKDITHRKVAEEVIKERNRELSLLNSVAVALNNTMDIEHILRLTLKNVLRVLRLKEGALFLIDREAKAIRLQTYTGLPIPASRDEIIFRDRLLQRHLVMEDTLLTPKPAFPAFKVQYRAEEGTVTWLTCFLITFKGKGVGFFGFALPAGRRLNLHEVHLLGSLGNFLGGTIENARLMRTIQQHGMELRRLTEKLFQSQEEERRRIARELHDEAGQSLTAVKLGLDRLEAKYGHDPIVKEEISEICKMLRRTTSEIRHISFRLHPTLLSDLGLEPALNLYFREIRNHCDIEIDFTMVGFDHRLDMDTETVLYRFSQETLTNTIKHANAEAFRLAIIKSFPRIIFFAEDDGVGFDTTVIGQDKRSLGLLGMRERAHLLGGTFQLRSRPGEGTRIRIEIPLNEDVSDEH